LEKKKLYTTGTAATVTTKASSHLKNFVTRISKCWFSGPKDVMLQKVNRRFVKNFPNIAHLCLHKYAVGQITTQVLNLDTDKRNHEGKVTVQVFSP